MNTSLTINQQTLSITNNPTWDQTTQFLHSTTPISPRYSKTSWKLHAEAKGFGRTPNNNTSMQKKSNAPRPGPNQQQEEDDDDKIPQVVFDRMVRRIVTSVGLPMATGVAFLKLFDFVKEKQLADLPLWVPFLTTFVFFGSSVLGVAYGSLSTSWDAERKGSLLGFDEAKENWTEMWKEEEENKK